MKKHARRGHGIRDGRALRIRRSDRYPIQSLHPHLRQGLLFSHPLLFQAAGVPHPDDAHPDVIYPQPLHPLAAGAAEKNKEQQDDDPPHVIAVKKIAKTSHDDTSKWSVGSRALSCCPLLYHSMRAVKNGHKNFCHCFCGMNRSMSIHTVSADFFVPQF